jgi:hypothetical protein
LNKKKSLDDKKRKEYEWLEVERRMKQIALEKKLKDRPDKKLYSSDAFR